MVKYRPIISYGASTGFLPIHIRIMNVEQIDQNTICVCVLNLAGQMLGFVMNGKKYKMQILMTSATTPPSFLGIDRRMAYIGKKYHSG